MLALKYSYDDYQLLVIGCGGTGSNLLYFLSRFLFNLNKNVLVTLIDADTVEEKNVTRQAFAPADIGENKAKVLANRYMNLLGLKMSYVNRNINSPEDLHQYTNCRNLYPIIIGCLDNIFSRSYLNEYFKHAYQLTYLDAGNAEAHGQVVMGVKYYGRTILQPTGYYFPQLIVPEKDESYTLSCADMGDQTMAANMLSAHVLFSYLSNILSGTENRYMTMFDAKLMGVFNKYLNECPEFENVQQLHYGSEISIVEL